MSTELDQTTQEALFEYLLRLGDDRLIVGHRLSEWCGHAPELEEDIALANMALDFVGQAESLLKLAGQVEGAGRSEDDLAYFRDEYEFRNLELVEQPRGDFAVTIARQFLFDAFNFLQMEALKESNYQPLADIAAKSYKETIYHLRHTREWVVRLGDGTEESHRRIQDALTQIWRFTSELFFQNDVDTRLREQGYAPDLTELRPKWDKLVNETLTRATLERPSDDIYMAEGSRLGSHSEHLGHLLSNMQILARSHPGATW